MIYGYIRVSSDKQTVENQRFEINNFCNKQEINIDGWIEETISGTRAYNKRQLGLLLNKVKKDSNKLTKSGTIIPVVDFQHINEVLVIQTTKEELKD